MLLNSNCVVKTHLVQSNSTAMQKMRYKYLNFLNHFLKLNCHKNNQSNAEIGK